MYVYVCVRACVCLCMYVYVCVLVFISSLIPVCVYIICPFVCLSFELNLIFKYL